MASSKKFTLFADFGQIHILDPGGNGSLEDAWNAQASEDRIAEGGDIVGIGAKDTEDVNVSVEVLAIAPPNDTEHWDHVTESSIDTSSPALAILGCSDERKSAKQIATPIGSLRIRAC